LFNAETNRIWTVYEDQELAHQATAAVEKTIHHEDMEHVEVTDSRVAEPKEMA
jgi:hypothetical protein